MTTIDTYLKGDYKKAAGSVQIPAVEACFSGKKGASGTKFPILRDFYAAVASRLAGVTHNESNSNSVLTVDAVINNEN